MQIKIVKPFLERALSPRAFQTNEFVTVPDNIAKKLIKAGHAVPLTAAKIPAIETR
jgi:hypothetical protein